MKTCVTVTCVVVYNLHFNFQHIADKAKGLLASLFHPLGMVSPVTVGMKVLYQEICNSKFDWDEVSTGEIKRKWDKWAQDLAETKEIRTNRGRGCNTESAIYMGSGMPARKPIVPWFTSCTARRMVKLM